MKLFLKILNYASFLLVVAVLWGLYMLAVSR